MTFYYFDTEREGGEVCDGKGDNKYTRTHNAIMRWPCCPGVLLEAGRWTVGGAGTVLMKWSQFISTSSGQDGQ